MKQRRRFRRTTIISAGLLAFLLGLVSANRFDWQFGMVEFLLLAPILVFTKKRTVLAVAAVFAVGFAAGLCRGSAAITELAKYDQYYQKSVQFSGIVMDDPVYDDQGRMDFRVGSVKPGADNLPGQIRVKAHVNGLRRGDSVGVSGKLMDGFGNYQGAMYYADVEILAHSNSPVEKIRREFFANVYSVLPEPHASLGLGFLVGLRSALPEDLDEGLRVVGLTHIVVASGYNLTVLVRLCRRGLARFSKYQAFAGSIALILGFVMVTGASPSMFRAGVVTILSLLAWYFGRRFQPFLIIMLGAAITAGFNPLYIWYDLGWWLSFLAFAGVLMIAPIIVARFYGDKKPPVIAQVATETIAAQALATPLIMLTFGKVSLVALLANVTVVPFIPWAMAGTFLAGVAGMLLSGGWAAWFALPAQLLLSYIVSATNLFALPAWAQQNISLSPLGMLALYALVLAVGVLAYKKSKLSYEKLPSVVE